MSDLRNVDPEKITVKQLVGMLTPSQFRACAAALIAVICGVFAFGAWVNQVRLEHKFSRDVQSELSTAVEKKTKEFNGRIEDLRKETSRQVLQIEFLERRYSYLYARVKDRKHLLDVSNPIVENARKQFAMMLQRMYKGGDVNKQKEEGYEFDESEAGNHKVIFQGGKSYPIPQDVKGDFIQRHWRNPG